MPLSCVSVAPKSVVASTVSIWPQVSPVTGEEKGAREGDMRGERGASYQCACGDAVPTMGDAILFCKLHLNVISQAAVVVLCPQLPHTRQAH